MDLKNIISKGTQAHERRWVIYGPEGVGKSTLASRFPSPIFIDLEGGTKDLDVTRVSIPVTSFSTLREVVEAIAAAPEFETMVFDTADIVDVLLSREVASRHHVGDIGELGWGQGYKELAMEWNRFLNRLSDIRKQVIFIAHAGTVKHEQPDELPSYDKWGIKTEKRSAAMLREWADEVLFLNFKSYVEKDATGKVKGKGGRKRVIYAQHTSAIEAKDRSGTLPAEMDADYALLAHLVGKPTAKAEPAAPAPAAPASKPAERHPMPVSPSATLNKLLDLMAIDNIASEAVRAAQVDVCRKYDLGQAIESYDEATLARLVNGWEGVKKWIRMKYAA